MNKALPYGILAKYYEDLTLNDYKRWSDYILDLIKLHAKGKSGVDIACGTGYFTRAIKSAGYDVYGVDISKDMLEKANELTIKNGLNINYLRQDIKSFKAFNKVDFITCICDGFNYIKNEDLNKSFKKIYSALNKGGAFIFDISSKYKLTKIIGNNVFFEDFDDLTYLWTNSLSNDKVDMDLTFFVKDGKNYVRYDESHTQFIHDTEKVVKILSLVGFSKIEVYGHLGEKLSKTSERVNFIAIK